MKLEALLLGLLLVLSSALAGPKTSEIFFHWGDVGGNQTLLGLGGYSDPGHSRDLSHGENALLNEEVLAKTREWYQSAGQPDAAGAGFYMSPDLFNSRGFGNDLLVVEITTDKNVIHEASSWEIKAKADTALRAGHFSELPLITMYHPYAGWQVLSRAMTPGEAISTKIVFRPPSAADVPVIWEQKILGRSKNEEEVLDRLAMVAGEITQQPDSRSRVTRSADVVYQRLLFDHAPEYLVKHLPDSFFAANEAGEVPGFGRFQSIFKAFEQKIPDDERTDRLFNRASKLLFSNQGPLESVAVLSFISENAKRVPEKERLEVFEWVLKVYKPEVLEKEVAHFIRLAGAAFDHLSPEQRQKARRFISRSIEASDFNPKEYSSVRKSLERIFGKARAQSMSDRLFLAKAQKLALEFGQIYNTNPRVNSPKAPEPRRAGLQLIEMAKILLQEKSAMSQERFDRLVRDFCEIAFKARPVGYAELARTDLALVLFDQVNDPQLGKKLRYIIEEKLWDTKERLKANHTAYQEFKDPKVIRAIKKLARKAKLPSELIENADIEELYYAIRKIKGFKDRVEKAVKQASRKRSSTEWATNPFAVYFETLTRDESMTAERFEKRVLEVLDAFPQLNHDIAEAITSSSKMSYTMLPISWSRLARTALERGDQAANVDEDVERAYITLVKAYQVVEKGEAPDKELFGKRYKRSLQNIPGSEVLSELSRTFVLVEPLFVSEDIRLMGATRPFERFNEELKLESGGTSTQPAWENFNEAWKNLAMPIWYTEPYVLDKEIYWLIGALDEAHSQLVATKVDGTSVGANSADLWDRSKFTTFISDGEWKDWKLGSSMKTLKRFFEVSKADGGYNLKFRDGDALRKTIPGINEVTNPEAKVPYALVRFIAFDAGKIANPIKRAARILYLTTRLHPYENGNGRFARLWAAMDLVRSGYPMPMGFPTSDFVMNQRQIELEVRKSVKLGEFWELMVLDAQKRNVKPEDFFQKVFRGSALEGLSHVSPRNQEELAEFVHWLEKQEAPPEWAAKFGKLVEKRLYEFHSGGGRIAKIDELARARMLEEAWSEFKPQVQTAWEGGRKKACVPSRANDLLLGN